MKAFRNVGGNVIEIEVDVDAQGVPLLPKDTTVDARPTPAVGHYVTVVGNAWVQIPLPVENFEFAYKKQLALEKLATYKSWYLDQPVVHATVTFDADELARNRLIQALVINGATGYLPPAWVAADNSAFPITTLADLSGLINTVQTAFATRFFEMNVIRDQLLASADEAALNAVVIPVKPQQF